MKGFRFNMVARLIVESVAASFGVSTSNTAWESTGSRKACQASIDCAIQGVERILRDELRSWWLTAIRFD